MNKQRSATPKATGHPEASQRPFSQVLTAQELTQTSGGTPEMFPYVPGPAPLREIERRTGATTPRSQIY